MKFNLVSWNVRGINDGGKRRVVKSCIEFWKADMRTFRKLNYRETFKR